MTLLYKILHEDDYINEIPSQFDTNLTNTKEKLQSKNVTEVDIDQCSLRVSFIWLRKGAVSRYLATMVMTLLQTFQFPS